MMMMKKYLIMLWFVDICCLSLIRLYTMRYGRQRVRETKKLVMHIIINNKFLNIYLCAVRSQIFLFEFWRKTKEKMCRSGRWRRGGNDDYDDSAAAWFVSHTYYNCVLADFFMFISLFFLRWEPICNNSYFCVSSYLYI